MHFLPFLCVILSLSLSPTASAGSPARTICTIVQINSFRDIQQARYHAPTSFTKLIKLVVELASSFIITTKKLTEAAASIIDDS